VVVRRAGTADDMNIRAAEDNMQSYYAHFRVGIDIDKRTKQERVIGLNRGNLGL